MQKGFYDLTSGMLTQNRILNNISNNLGNMATTGYKRDELMTRTFDDRMQTRTGDRNKISHTDLAEAAMLRTVDETYTVFEQGHMTETGRSLDFGIYGDAFFQIEPFDGGGTTYYTRNGSFTMDEDGALILQNVGYVLNGQGGHIELGTDKVKCDSKGLITNIDTGEEYGTIGLVTFTDTNALLKSTDAEGMFTNPDGDGNIAGADAPASEIVQCFLEDSNVNLTDAMADMISAERAFQSTTQILRMYDEILNTTVTEIARHS